jgi:hypothetical protein
LEGATSRAVQLAEVETQRSEPEELRVARRVERQLDVIAERTVVAQVDSTPATRIRRRWCRRRHSTPGRRGVDGGVGDVVPPAASPSTAALLVLVAPLRLEGRKKAPASPPLPVTVTVARAVDRPVSLLSI